VIEIDRLMRDAGTERPIDLDAWETYVKDHVMAVGAKQMEALMQRICDEKNNRPITCTCGRAMRNVGLKKKSIQTLLGQAHIRRPLFVCSGCGNARFPDDQRMGIEGTRYSPGAKRVMARSGSRSSFHEASEDLKVYANLDINRKEIERVTKEIGRAVEQWKPEASRETKRVPIMYISFDGTGIPMQKAALAGRIGKQPDGTAKTREVKLGCVFTQTSTDQEGRPVRDPESTTYVGALETSHDFGWRIHEEAQKRGVHHADQVVILTDGARYNKTIVEKHFPSAIHIIDLYHAREHLYNVSKLLLRESEKSREAKWLDLLDTGQITSLLTEIRKQSLVSGTSLPKKVLTEINYFAENASHMKYSEFRAQGFFIGSGVIEAGCRSLIGARLKKSGMFWSVKGANAVIALRCCLYSHRFEDFWQDRAA
jgi:hypothetical protein